MLMLVAYGPNEVRIPCRFFRDQAEADAFTAQWMIPEYVKLDTRWGRTMWRVLDPREAGALYHEVFTRYYGGCGEVYMFEVLPMPINEAFLDWDLD